MRPAAPSRRPSASRPAPSASALPAKGRKSVDDSARGYGRHALLRDRVTVRFKVTVGTVYYRIYLDGESLGYAGGGGLGGVLAGGRLLRHGHAALVVVAPTAALLPERKGRVTVGRLSIGVR